MYANWGLAWRTNRTYGSGERRFIRFCLMHRLVHDSGDILPASEGTLIYFASYLARSVRHSTIKLYFAAVHNLHISCGHSDLLVGKLLLKKCSEGYSSLPRATTNSTSTRSPGGFTCYPSLFSKPGWVPKTFRWFGPRSLLPFLVSFVAVNSLTKGFTRFALVLT